MKPPSAHVLFAAALLSVAGAPVCARAKPTLAERLGLDGFGVVEAPGPECAAIVCAPAATWAGEATPDAPPEEGFADRLVMRPARQVVIRPIGVPWFLPRELGSGERGDRPGPGVGIGLSWRPSPHWRFGGDLVVRAERVDADNRLYDWTGYFAPGVEFVPNPNAARPLAFGVITPAALRPREEGWAGVFFVIRWMDAGARKPGGVRGGED